MSTIFKNKKTHHINSSYDVLDNLRTAILILDKDFNYVYTNASAVDLLGSATAIKKLTELRCENVSLSTYLNNISSGSQSVMLRDLKFKNFDRIERIVDCNISSYYDNETKYILLELNETGRLYNISLDQNLIDQQKATREMVKVYLMKLKTL